MNADTLEYVASLCAFRDALTMRLVCAHFHASISDHAFKIIAHREWGEEFWRRAAQRPRRVSRPLSTYREELLRIDSYATSSRCALSHEFFYMLWQHDSVRS